MTRDDITQKESDMQIPVLAVWNELTVSARYVVLGSIPEAHTPTGKLKKVFASATGKDWSELPDKVRQTIAWGAFYVIPERVTLTTWANFTNAPFIKQAWDYFLAEAEKDKQHSIARKSRLDTAPSGYDQWLLSHIVLPVETLALRAYSYSYYRATSRACAMWLDPSEHRLWVDNGWITE